MNDIKKEFEEKFVKVSDTDATEPFKYISSVINPDDIWLWTKQKLKDRDKEWRDKIGEMIRPLSKRDEEENYIQPLIAFDIGYNRALKELLEDK